MKLRHLFLKADLTIENVAFLLNTNRTYLSQAINNQGMNFRTYLNKYRLNYFLELVNSFDYNHLDLIDVEDLVILSGFSNSRMLNRLVKREFGYSIKKLLIEKKLYFCKKY
ncbi:MAG: hypothetical protein WC140_06845 [Bacteroidales bacterium]